MGANGCEVCGPGAPQRGRGVIHDPFRRWWQIFKTVRCPDCDGSGYRKPVVRSFIQSLQTSPNPPRRRPWESIHTKDDEGNPIKPKVVIFLSSFAGQNYLTVDVDCVDMGRIPITQDQSQDEAFIESLRRIIKICVGGR